jgi:transposase
LRQVFNGLRRIIRAGAPWRMMPNDLPPWFTVYQQTQRWIAAKGFETMVQNMRVLLRLSKRAAHPQPFSTAAHCKPV